MKQLFCAILICATTHAFAQHQADVYDMHGAPEPHLHLQKGQRTAGPGHTSSALLTNHGGAVLHSSKTVAIFWGAEWTSSIFAADKITGLDRFFNAFGGSRYASTGNEYRDSIDYVTASSAYSGHVIDSSAAPTKAPRTTSTIVAEACKVAANSPDPSAVYFVYTSTAAGNVNYCAWHSWGNCSNGAPIQVAYMPNIDGIAGCDPVDKASGNSQGLAALANVTGHELMEAITDPRGTGWLDSSGQENADKCAWSFPPGDGLSTLYDGSKFKIQMEWSNAAFSTSTGLPNLQGQKACIY